jgi:hypothetical protein
MTARDEENGGVGSAPVPPQRNDSDPATIARALRRLTGDGWQALTDPDRDRTVLMEHLLAALDQLADTLDAPRDDRQERSNPAGPWGGIRWGVR